MKSLFISFTGSQHDSRHPCSVLRLVGGGDVAWSENEDRGHRKGTPPTAQYWMSYYTCKCDDCDNESVSLLKADEMAEKIGYPPFILNDTALDESYNAVGLSWQSFIITCIICSICVFTYLLFCVHERIFRSHEVVTITGEELNV